jgi:hypothetical protein
MHSLSYFLSLLHTLKRSRTHTLTQTLSHSLTFTHPSQVEPHRQRGSLPWHRMPITRFATSKPYLAFQPSAAARSAYDYGARRMGVTAGLSMFPGAVVDSGPVFELDSPPMRDGARNRDNEPKAAFDAATSAAARCVNAFLDNAATKSWLFESGCEFCSFLAMDGCVSELNRFPTYTVPSGETDCYVGSTGAECVQQRQERREAIDTRDRLRAALTQAVLEQVQVGKGRQPSVEWVIGVLERLLHAPREASSSQPLARTALAILNETGALDAFMQVQNEQGFLNLAARLLGLAVRVHRDDSHGRGHEHYSPVHANGSVGDLEAGV